MIVTIK